MIRKIITIEEEKCNGCGLCAHACHEGAIDIINGKAKLTRESFCDGFGDCLPTCPTGAIHFEEREAPAYDEAAVKALQQERKSRSQRKTNRTPSHSTSCLRQWPCQIKLLPEKAAFFEGAHLLIAADCTAFAYANFHEDFMRGRITLNGCPKLDAVDYTEKLTAILSHNAIQSVTIVRMEVPCCGGLQRAGENAHRASGKCLPWQVVTISRDGRVVV